MVAAGCQDIKAVEAITVESKLLSVCIEGNLCTVQPWMRQQLPSQFPSSLVPHTWSHLAFCPLGHSFSSDLVVKKSQCPLYPETSLGMGRGECATVGTLSAPVGAPPSPQWPVFIYPIVLSQAEREVRSRTADQSTQAAEPKGERMKVAMGIVHGYRIVCSRWPQQFSWSSLLPPAPPQPSMSGMVGDEVVVWCLAWWMSGMVSGMGVMKEREGTGGGDGMLLEVPDAVSAAASGHAGNSDPFSGLQAQRSWLVQPIPHLPCGW